MLNDLPQTLGRLAAHHYHYQKVAGIQSAARSVYDKHKDIYNKLSDRYGKTGAGAIAASYLLGAPIPGPGTGLITALPALGIAEALHKAKLIGKQPDPLQIPKKFKEPTSVRIALE